MTILWGDLVDFLLQVSHYKSTDDLRRKADSK